MTTATIDDLDVAGKKVLLRVDFNVPMHDGRILDDRRIREVLPTLQRLVDRGARTVVVTHLGRPRGRFDASLSVRPVAQRLSELLSGPVALAQDVVGPSAQHTVDGLSDGGVAMLDNVRFEPGEEANDAAFADRLAALADLYVNDAFGAAHRAHASTEGVAHRLPAVAGYLMARELAVLGGVLEDPKRPLVSVIGGAKISTKLGVLNHLMDRADTLFVGGAMACTFFRADGAATGQSLVEEDQVETARRLLEAWRTRGGELVLPHDVVVAAAAAPGAATEVVAWDHIADDRMVVDVGPDSVAEIAASFAEAGTVVWNGPLGIYEIDDFARGTRAVAQALAGSRAVSVVGGGDLAAAVEDAGVADEITFISTGGGATLEFLEGHTLPGVAALRERETVAG